MKCLAFRVAAALAAVTLTAAGASAATLSAMATFGGGDGWLSPAEATYLQGGTLQRGLTYNPANNHLYLVDRNGGTFVRILDGNTGALLGNLDVTGVTGGTFTLNMIDVADDGTIYAANLSISATSNFKVYRWANEAAVPTVAFDGVVPVTAVPLVNRTRTGDTFAVQGSGASTRFIAAGGSTAGQHYGLFTTADGLTYTATSPALTGAATGAFRLGIDFAGASTVIGKQPSAPFTSAPTAGGAATTSATTSNGEAPIAWYGPNNYLASVDVNSNLVRLYDGTNLGALSVMDSANLTTGAAVANGNGTGDLKFGRYNGGPLRLYVMNSNNGIQAFMVPEPATTLLAATGVLALAALRRRRDS